jgi:hypothetical protein
MKTTNRLLLDAVLVAGGLYLLLCCSSAHCETDIERGVRIHRLYQRFNTDLKNSCVVLCHFDLRGDVDYHLSDIPTRIKVVEPKAGR